MFVGGPVSQVVRRDGHDTGCLSAFHHAFSEWREGDFREEGEDVDAHDLGVKVHSQIRTQFFKGIDQGRGVGF